MPVLGAPDLLTQEVPQAPSGRRGQVFALVVLTVRGDSGQSLLRPQPKKRALQVPCPGWWEPPSFLRLKSELVVC